MTDLSIREKMVSVSLVLIIVGLGLYPQPIFDIAKPALLKTLDNHNAMTIQKHEDCKSVTNLSKQFFYK